jgi:hypothetical protein
MRFLGDERFWHFGVHHQVEVHCFRQTEIDGGASERIGVLRLQTVIYAQDFYRLLDGIGQSPACAAPVLPALLTP